MSKFADLAISSDLHFVLPAPGKMMFVPVVDANDVALCFTFGFGYFETSSLEMCEMIRAYFKSNKATNADIVGSIDKVIKYGEIEVYRQRVKYSNLLAIFAIIKKFECYVEVSDTFCITNAQYKHIIAATHILNKYLERCHKGMGLNEWLTSCCKAYLLLLGQVYDVSIEVALNTPVEQLDGLFMRSPFLCAGYSMTHPEMSSIVLLKPAQLHLRIENRVYSLGGNRGYLHKNTVIYGYTKRNLRADIKTKFIEV